MLTQFVQDFFHLERGEDGFDQHGGLDRALRQADLVLGHHEDVVPQARFQMAFHLRQVEERAGAAGDLFLGVVEQEEREVEDAARHAFTVDQHMLLVQVPAARTHLQRGDLVVELVRLAVLLQRERAADGGLQVDLALDLVVPAGRIRIFEVGHVAVRARVERVDDHLGIDRAGDFHAAAVQCLRDRGNLPVAFTHGLRFRQEIRALAGVQALGTLDTGSQQLFAARLKGTVQLGNQRQCFGGQNVFVGRQDLGLDLHALGQRERHGCSPEDDVRVERVRPYVWADLECLRSVALPVQTAADRACRGQPRWAPRRAPRADAPGG